MNFQEEDLRKLGPLKNKICENFMKMKSSMPPRNLNNINITIIFPQSTIILKSRVSNPVPLVTVLSVAN